MTAMVLCYNLTSAILALIAKTKFDLMIAIFTLDIAIPINILINVNNLLNGYFNAS